jgi:putative endonuclease
MSTDHGQVSMRSPRQKLGDIGEDAALAHLRANGYQLIERNWRCRLGEIDLIMRDGNQLVFVEVRTRQSNITPAESIVPAKQQRLIALAYTYLQANHQPEQQSWRIDVIAIQTGPHRQIRTIDHILYAVEAHQ